LRAELTLSTKEFAPPPGDGEGLEGDIVVLGRGGDPLARNDVGLDGVGGGVSTEEGDIENEDGVAYVHLLEGQEKSSLDAMGTS
jgi:hypothetical protein